MSLRFVDLEASNSRKQNKSQHQSKFNFYSYSSNNDSQKLSPVYSSRNRIAQTKRKTAKQGKIALKGFFNKFKALTLIILLFILISLCIGYLLDSATKSKTKPEQKKSETKSEQTKSQTNSEQKKSQTKSEPTKSQTKAGQKKFI